jgi:hypothetical protein
MRENYMFHVQAPSFMLTMRPTMKSKVVFWPILRAWAAEN